jgi:predicted ABC-type ATPase
MESRKPRPTMFILAGPNGAGKSTLYEKVIAQIVKAPFINADQIQKTELQDQSMNAAYEAARIAETRRQDKIANKQSFVTESTFSHPAKLELIKHAKAAGFRVIVYHVNVRTANISVARVASRVESGGHNVPEDKIRERFERNQHLIKEAVLRADRAFVFDNSALNKHPSLSMEFLEGQVARVSGNVPEWARSLYKNELRRKRL